jgi:hypothetical protein
MQMGQCKNKVVGCTALQAGQRPGQGPSICMGSQGQPWAVTSLRTTCGKPPGSRIVLILSEMLLCTACYFRKAWLSSYEGSDAVLDQESLHGTRCSSRDDF